MGLESYYGKAKPEVVGNVAFPTSESEHCRSPAKRWANATLLQLHLTWFYEGKYPKPRIRCAEKGLRMRAEGRGIRGGSRLG